VIILRNKRKNFSLGLLIFRLISLIIILICLALLYNWNLENNTNSELADNLSESFITGVTQTTQVNPTDETSEENVNSSPSYETIEVNFQELLNHNEQAVALIKINNTNINFPIVKGNDNSYYLTHNFDKKSNSAGWIFADYTNNFDTLDKNTLIYGHNRRNNTMFSNLKYLLNPEWFNDNLNKYFIFNTKDHKYIAQIFSVYKINANSLLLSNSFENEEAFNQFITDCKQKSIYNFDIEVPYEDNIITLCTCDNNTQYRIVVHAKLINVN